MSACKKAYKSCKRYRSPICLRNADPIKPTVDWLSGSYYHSDSKRLYRRAKKPQPDMIASDRLASGTGFDSISIHSEMAVEFKSRIVMDRKTSNDS